MLKTRSKVFPLKLLSDVCTQGRTGLPAYLPPQSPAGKGAAPAARGKPWVHRVVLRAGRRRPLPPGTGTREVAGLAAQASGVGTGDRESRPCVLPGGRRPGAQPVASSLTSCSSGQYQQLRGPRGRLTPSLLRLHMASPCPGLHTSVYKDGGLSGLCP